MPGWRNGLRGLLACPLLLAGCMFFELEHDLTRFTDLAVIQGRVSQTVDHTSPLVVAVSSELPLEIQRGATRVLGFDEGHESILESEEVSDALNEALATIEP